MPAPRSSSPEAERQEEPRRAMREPLDTASDALLATRAADGDARAFEALVRRHGPFLRAFALRLLRSNADADDVVQEALITAWQKLDMLADPSKARSWLATIVSRTATDRMRSARRTEPIEALELPSLDAGPEASAMASSRVRALRAVLAELPEEQREVWWRKEVGALSYDEIAEQLEIPVSTVRGRLARARQFVLERMEEWR